MELGRTDKPKRRYQPEEIIVKVRQVDVLVSQGQNIADAIRQIGVSEVVCPHRNRTFGAV